MRTFVQLAIVAAAACLAGPVHAESLRCDGYLASEGDSRLSVFYKCGPPLLTDVYCPQVYYPQTLNPVPVPYSYYVPCQPVEEWLYERGPGSLTATVRFRAGVVQSITYGQSVQRRTYP
jgi:hypothetical protein